MDDMNTSSISNNFYANDSDDEEEWRKEITELKAFRAGLEEETDDQWESSESSEKLNVLNVILSCSEYSSSSVKVLIMNRAMICMLRQMKSQVLANLRINAEKQAELFKDLKYIHDKKNTSFASVLKCGIPYFKLQNDWGQPSNMYSKQHKKLGYASPDLFIRNSYCWSLKDSITLKQLVVDCTRENKLTELENKVRLMSRHGSSANAFEKTFKQIEKLQRKEEKEINPDTVDWLRVSCNLGNIYTPSECQTQWQYFVDPKINNSQWTIKEKQAFFALVKEHGFQSWDKIAKLHEFGRTALQCCILFHRSIFEAPGQNLNFDEEKCIALYECYKNKSRPILKIAFFMDCNITDCRLKLKYLNLPKFINQSAVPLKKIKKDLKVAFDHVEESKLRHLTEKHAILNRESTFTSEEDFILLQAVVNHGKQWDIVTEAVPGRDQMEVRQRYEKLIIFSKHVLKSIDRAASSMKLDLLPSPLPADSGHNVWSILQLFWEPPNAKIAQSVFGLPLGNEISPATQQLLKILEFGHKNIFGPRFPVPRTSDRRLKVATKMAVICQTLDLHFSPSEINEKLQIHSINTFTERQGNCAENIIVQLADCVLPDLSCTLNRSLIPPNVLTLVGARVLSSVRGLLNSQAQLSHLISTTTVNPCIRSQDRLLPCESKERLKNRIFSMFFLSLCMSKVARYPSHYVSSGTTSLKTKKKKLTTLKRKRNLRKISFKRWNKTEEEPIGAENKKKHKKRCKTPPTSNEQKKARMIRVTKITGRPPSIKTIDSD